MKRVEFRELEADLHLHARAIEQAAEKMRSGDVRGARVRLEDALELLRRIETDSCNESGLLCDPGEELT